MICYGEVLFYAKIQSYATTLTTVEQLCTALHKKEPASKLKDFSQSKNRKVAKSIQAEWFYQSSICEKTQMQKLWLDCFLDLI